METFNVVRSAVSRK